MITECQWVLLEGPILDHFEHRFIHSSCTFRKSGWVEMSLGVSIVNLDRRTGVVKPHTMPDTLPQVGYHRSVPSMIIYNPLTTRMTTTHNQ